MPVKSDLPPRHVAWFDPKTGRPSSTFAAWAEATQKRLGAGTDDKVEVAAQGAEGASAAATVAQDAAVTANAAAASATAAAATANTAAGTANETIAVAAGYPVGLTITASADGATAKVVISDHTMIYPIHPTPIAITGATLTGLAYDTFYNIYYDDPTFAGGAVTFHAVTDDTAFPTAAHPIRIFLGTARTPPTSADPPQVGAGRSPYGQNTSI